MVIPLIPIAIGLAAGATASGMAVHAIGKKREEKLEEALAVVASEKQGELPPEAAAVLTPVQVAAIKAKGLAIGIRTGRAQPPGQEKLTPPTKPMQGLMTPMERMGGW